MGLFDWMPAWGRSAPAAAPSRSRELAAAMDHARLARRRFEGAVVDRLTSSWMTTNVAIDDELRRDLDKLRARSRDLFKNNEHAAKFARLVRNNVVGPEGFTFHSRAANPDGTLDTADCRAIENAFWDWCKPQQLRRHGAPVLRRHLPHRSTSLARDGEFLIKRVRNAGKYGYQLQPINVDRLDTMLNRAPTAGQNAIIMGVEVDAVRRPVAYHIWTSMPGLGADPRRTRERMPAARSCTDSSRSRKSRRVACPGCTRRCASSTTSRATAKPR
jgi:capsid protein